VSAQPDQPDILHARGVEAAQAGRLDEALELLQGAAAGNPGEPTCHSNLGSVLQALGRLEEAAEAHERAVELSARQLALHCYNLGAALGALRQLDRAEAAYRRALEHFPGFVQALDNLGTVLQHQGKLDQAEAAYRRALELQPDNVLTCRNLGSALCVSGRLAEAEAVYRQALELAPDEAVIHVDLGITLRLQARLDDAEAAYRHALRIDPAHAAAYEHLGTVLLSAGKADDAEAAHRRATELAPDSADAHNALGATLASQGRFADAIAVLERALELRPGWMQARYNLGVVLHNQGALEAALAAYQAVLALAPEHLDAKQNLAEVLRRLERFDEALDAYRAILARDPDNVAVRHMLAALGGETPARAPAEYVRQTFDDYASRFDEHLVDQLEYRVPELMRRAVDRLAPGRRFAAGLDLGCGTGLVAARFRDLVAELHGVDLSAKMIARAREKGIYDLVHQDELIAFLRATQTRYDLFTAGDVLIYLGALDELFAAVRARIRPGGLFVFTLEHAEQGEYGLRTTGRFAHSTAYLRTLARDHALTVLGDDAVDLRREHDAPVRGILAVLAPVA
jgi:predicted TPR repeat methyltransferase